MNEDLASSVRVYLDWLDEVRGWETEPCASCGAPYNNHRYRHSFVSAVSQAERARAIGVLAKAELVLRIKSGWNKSRAVKRTTRKR